MSDYSTIALEDLCVLRNGAGIKQGEFGSDGAKIIRVSDFTDYGIDTSSSIRINAACEGRWSEHYLSKGIVLVATVGSWGTSATSAVGKVVVVPKEADGCLQNQNTCALIAKRDKADQRYIFYALNTSQFREYVSCTAAGSANQARLSVKNLGKFETRNRPFHEQQAIAHILGTLDDKIELNRKTSETLEGIAKALFKSWFLDFDPVRAKAEGRPTGLPDEISELLPASFDESELGEIPSKWSLMPLDKIANYLNGLALQKFPPKGDHTDLPVIKIAQLRKGDTVDSGKCSNELGVQYVIKDGDILFSWSGSLLVDVWVGGTGALNQHLFKVTSQDFEKWFYYWWTKHYLEEFQAIAQSKATTMGHIQRKHLSEALVVVPPEKILEWMNEIFSPILNQQIQGRLESRTLTSLRDALLPRLISGELRVPDAEKMLEEVGV
tara:strand:+ start:578 stop:1894 length:1317 start_codon:yes stop_codon:yes gene_type:complete